MSTGTVRKVIVQCYDSSGFSKFSMDLGFGRKGIEIPEKCTEAQKFVEERLPKWTTHKGHVTVAYKNEFDNHFSFLFNTKEPS